MKTMLKGLATAALLSAAATSATAQTGGNILLNPDFEAGIASGSTYVDTPVSPSLGFAFGPVAADSWGFLSRPLPAQSYSVQTELLPSDFVAGGSMLHVQAHNVPFVIIFGSLAYRPAMPHRAAFCAWVKVVRGHATGLALDYTIQNDVDATGDWQQLILNADNPSALYPTINVLPQIPADSVDNINGDEDFYIATADLTLRGNLSQCPRATIDDLSRGRDPLYVPPRRPVVEHPEWQDRPIPDDRDSGPARRGKPRDMPGPSQNAPWGQK